jgi:hypothetical protein
MCPFASLKFKKHFLEKRKKKRKKEKGLKPPLWA